MWPFSPKRKPVELSGEDLPSKLPAPYITIVNKAYDDGNGEFLASANRVFQEPAFKQVIQHLSDLQIQHSAVQADSWERILFHRASINGLNLVFEEFETLSAKHQDLVSPKETFNKHDIL